MLEKSMHKQEAIDFINSHKRYRFLTPEEAKGIPAIILTDIGYVIKGNPIRLSDLFRCDVYVKYAEEYITFLDELYGSLGGELKEKCKTYLKIPKEKDES